MAAEFRQRTPGEYARILWRRKWLIVLPTIAIATAIAWVVWHLPNVYESKTVLIIKPPTIPNVAIAPLSEDDLALRLNNITQILQSRAALEPLIVKYNLYAPERERGVPMETLIEKMRKNIEVSVEQTDKESKLPAFRIAFKGYDQTTTRDVTAELASMYVNEQTQSISVDTENAKKFYEEQLKKAQEELSGVEKRRLDYMRANSSRLPSTSQSLIAQLDGLRRQEQALIDAIARLQESKTRITGQIANYQELDKLEREKDLRNNNDVTNNPTYSDLINKKAALEAEYRNLKRELTDKNPEVIAKKTEIETIERRIKELEDRIQTRAERSEAESKKASELRMKSLLLDKASIESELKRQEEKLDRTRTSIIEMEGRLNSVPETEVALEGYNQELRSVTLQRDQLLEEKNKIEIAYKALIEQKGLLVQVIDPASLPQRPVAPKRFTLVVMGLGLGLAVGLFLAGVFEIPRLFTIQNADDAAHYTHLPVLASVPELLTPQEARWKPVRATLAVAAGIIATLISIPVLAIVLSLARIFDRFVA
jgi:polysaccharide chain length determinant protein (PEP-CTERM system associated)